MKLFSSLLIVLSISLAILVQYLGGNAPLPCFAFPVNVASMALFWGIVYVLHREYRHHPLVKVWSSAYVSIVLLLLALIGCLFIAFKPHFEVQQSVPFLVLLLLLLSNLILVIFRYQGAQRVRFYLTHIGLLIYISSLAWGAPDMHRWKVLLTPGETAEYAHDQRGIPHALGYALTLHALDASFYPNGIPQSYHAQVGVAGEVHDILVNQPWHRSWKEDLYITNYGVGTQNRKPYAVIEIIVQPWKYLTYLGLILTAVGAILLLWGKKINMRKS